MNLRVFYLVVRQMLIFLYVFNYVIIHINDGPMDDFKTLTPAAVDLQRLDNSFIFTGGRVL